MYLQKVISRKTFYEKYFFVGLLKVNDENRRIRIWIWIHLSEADLDPDPHQNAMDPQHCKKDRNIRLYSRKSNL
jgi:hypothetical protein